jgi:beta-lactamase class A
MNRRDFHAALLLAAAPSFGMAASAAPSSSAPWPSIELAARGRLGVAVLDTATGAVEGHRLDERFPMCSTFKWIAAALVLQRVDAGLERLERRVAIDTTHLPPHSPVSGRAGGELSVGELCEAAVTLSDNGAANQMLADFGGPPAFTAFARRLGAVHTRLDRIEPALNESRPGDPRDTTTPRDMAVALRAALFGDVLSAASKEQLARWLVASKTGDRRLRAGLPAGWRVGDKTGTGAQGSTNDVAVAWPTGRAPIVIAAYLTATRADDSARDAALASVARAVARKLE